MEIHWLIIRSCQFYPASFILKTFNVGSNEDQFVDQVEKIHTCDWNFDIFHSCKNQCHNVLEAKKTLIFWVRVIFYPALVEFWWMKVKTSLKKQQEDFWRSFWYKKHSPVKKYFCLSLHQLAFQFQINISYFKHKKIRTISWKQFISFRKASEIYSKSLNQG